MALEKKVYFFIRHCGGVYTMLLKRKKVEKPPGLLVGKGNKTSDKLMLP